MALRSCRLSGSALYKQSKWLSVIVQLQCSLRERKCILAAMLNALDGEQRRCPFPCPAGIAAPPLIFRQLFKLLLRELGIYSCRLPNSSSPAIPSHYPQAAVQLQARQGDHHEDHQGINDQVPDALICRAGSGASTGWPRWWVGFSQRIIIKSLAGQQPLAAAVDACLARAYANAWRSVGMDWSNKIAVVALIVALVAAYTAHTVRRQLKLDDWTPTRKWKKLAAKPRREPTPVQYTFGRDVGESERRFFEDTTRLAEGLNDLYGNSSWSFQDAKEPRTTEGGRTGAVRLIHIWHGEVSTGMLGISTRHYDVAKRAPVYITFTLSNARMFAGSDVVNLALEAAHLVCSTADALVDARLQIHRAMIANLWQIDGDDPGNEIEVSFTGTLSDHIVGSARELR
jgi:hypothetical protein